VAEFRGDLLASEVREIADDQAELDQEDVVVTEDQMDHRVVPDRYIDVQGGRLAVHEFGPADGCEARACWTRFVATAARWCWSQPS